MLSFVISPHRAAVSSSKEIFSLEILFLGILASVFRAVVSKVVDK